MAFFDQTSAGTARFTVAGLSASDFTFGGGVAGNFAIVDGALDFTVTSIVPEPGTGWFVAPAVLVFVFWSQRKRCRVS